jgi:hypothetical protein
MADTDEDTEARVRKWAYHLWQEEGCPQGQEKVHWDKARELVAIEDNQATATEPVESAESLGPEGEPVESAKLLRNLGEFPTLTDQGEQQIPRRRSEKR